MSIGIDYSMSCPAACHYTEDKMVFWYAHTAMRMVNAYMQIPNMRATLIMSDGTVSERAARLAKSCVTWIWSVTQDNQVYIEDYAFAATGRVFHIGENTGILKHFLDNEAIEYTPVPPTVVKKFATGKGTADKHKMTQAFLLDYPPAVKWLPVFFPRFKDGQITAKSPLSDLADAYWIAKYAYAQGR